MKRYKKKWKWRGKRKQRARIKNFIKAIEEVCK
jgi:hypothetical protein